MTLDKAADLRLMMEGAGTEATEVPREMQWAVTAGSGLLGAVAGSNEGGPLIRNEQFIGFERHPQWCGVNAANGRRLPVYSKLGGRDQYRDRGALPV